METDPTDSASQLLKGIDLIIYRTIFFLIGLSSLLTDQVVECQVRNCYDWYKYFSVQTNYMIVIWFGLAIWWRNDSQKLENLQGFIKGGITVFVTITSLVYHFLLSAINDPQGLQQFTNIVSHYVSPWAFIIDWAVAERDKYQWKWVGIWLVYPIMYLIFGLIYGQFTGNPIYFFLDLGTLGWSGLFVWVFLLLSFFVTVGAIYTAINRRLIHSSE